MKHFTTFLDFTPDEIQTLVSRAMEIKAGSSVQSLRGKSLGMLFFNPSLRTRISFELAMQRFGGSAISLSSGSDVWALETKVGAVMNGTTVEHIKDASQVLGRYFDALAVRSFSKMESLEEDSKETTINCFREFAAKPIVSMESAVEHPCQALADMLTIKEKFKGKSKPRFVLTWAPHIKAIPMAVPHSALLAASYLGLPITLTHPEGFDLSPHFVGHIKKTTEKLGGSFEISHDQEASCRDAEIIYAKNWTAPYLYTRRDDIAPTLSNLCQWLVSERHLSNANCFMHCLPVRRNVEVHDSVLDGKSSAVYDQAENRLWAQVAVLESIFS